MYGGIEHVTLTARDVDKLSSWYCRVLEFREYYRSAGVVFLRHDSYPMIEVLAGPGGINTTLQGNSGAAIFAIRVTDLDEAISDLRNKKVELVDEPMSDKYCRIQFFRDGENNLLHLVERFST
jgi:catechol 2,3-dioxygenase-like lactoylglutathione lyase family enzyme